MKRKLLATVLATLVAGLTAVVVQRDPVQASPADFYSPAAPYFGAGNLPPGCENDELVGPQMDRGTANPNNVCHHMRTDMNGLDSSQVDVLVMVPASPTTERDMRIMRQAVEMWEGGIDYLAEEMGLDWLAKGMDFHITVDAFDPVGGDGGEFTTYPIVDPEIVVIATNPVGGAGIGIDPVDAVFVNENFMPCTNVPNFLDIEQWEAVPGFNSHHESRSGTYVTEDCPGGGGNICFAVNAAVDPAPGAVQDGSVFGAFPFSLFDLVAHEFGHCLTIGHVGDGLEGSWGALPTNDIMAYHDDPPGLTKCVSTLDVEAVALRMSKYIDVNGDGKVDGADQLEANDPVGEGGNPFQVQHPKDHLYASSTGSPMDCPQPDVGLLPGERTDWTPTPVRAYDPVLTITSPPDGAESDTGIFDITGTVERRAIEAEPLGPTGFVDDADDDASSPVTEIKRMDVSVTDSHVSATVSLAELWPSTQAASAVSYSVVINDRKFDSFIRYAIDPNPMTWDNGGAGQAAGYMPAGTSKWDLAAKTVRFDIPRDRLASGGILSPYSVQSHANFGFLSTAVVDDKAPDGIKGVGVAAARSASISLPGLPAGAQAETVNFTHPSGNRFYPEQSTFGVNRGTAHTFALNVPAKSDVRFVLSFTEGPAGADLDLVVSGAASSEALGATTANPEDFTLTGIQGDLSLKVDPYFVTDPLAGSTYTLTAHITPLEVVPVDTDGDGIVDGADLCPGEPGIAPTGCPDTDGDGVIDLDDSCPSEFGEGADGCPILPTEHVRLWIGGGLAASQAVDTINGPDNFSLPVALAEGTFEARIDWEIGNRVVATRYLTLTHRVDDDGDGVPNDVDRCPGFDDFDDTDTDGVPDGCDTDSDGDGHADHRDNCPDVPNADQANMDGDKKGDACDSDMDGDGHSNGKERAHGTNPADPSDFPGKPKKKAIA